jgi:hypothetical protein
MDLRVIKTELTCDKILDCDDDDDDDKKLDSDDYDDDDHHLSGCITTGDFLKATQEG